MEILLCSSIGVFLGFLFYIITMFWIPPSFSDSFYLLENIKNGLGYIFTGVLWVMAFTLLPVWLNCNVGTDLELLKFFCCASLCFVGAAPHFKGIDKRVHTIAAITSAITGLLWILICTKFWYIIIGFLLLLLLLMYLTKTFKCYIFWLEMVMFFSVYLVLLLLM